MTNTTTVQVPAGWYADPVTMTASGTATQRRWWDGVAWSTHTAPFEAPQPVTSTVAPATTRSSASSAPTTVGASDSARIAENMPLHSVAAERYDSSRFATDIRAAAPYSALSPASSSAHELASSTAPTEYEPFAHRRRVEMLESTARRTTNRNPLGLGVHTASIWLMATMPLTQAMLIFWVFSSLPPESSAWTRALTIALPFVLYAALAGQDARQLDGSGHLRTVSWLAVLIAPPLYIALRGVRVARATGAAPWPLFVWLAVQLSVVVAWWIIDPAAAQQSLQLFA